MDVRGGLVRGVDAPILTGAALVARLVAWRDALRAWDADDRQGYADLIDVTTALAADLWGPDWRDDAAGPGVAREGGSHGGGTPRVPSGPHKSHALCGQVCLPGFLYAELVRLRGGEETEARAYVEAWWLRLDSELARGHPPIGDGLAYLRQRWAQDHPTPKPAPKTVQFDVAAWVAKGSFR
jgi:hypothetical protein